MSEQRDVRDDDRESTTNRFSSRPRRQSGSGFGWLVFPAHLSARLYVTAIVTAAIGIAVVAVFGAGVVTGVGGLSNLNPFTLFNSPETVVEDRPVVINQIQSLARLETTKYSMEVVIPAQQDRTALGNLLFGDRILLVAHGYVSAGVDLSRLGEDDVQVVDSETVWIMLPPSEIFHTTLDNDLTRVYDRQRGWLTRGDDHLETETRREAEQRILDTACEQDILIRATDDAVRQITTLLELLEFAEITVVASTGECTTEDST
jgi:hypothetical protein